MSKKEEKCTCEKCTKPEYGFYSHELKQVFDTVEDLKNAEAKYHEELDAKAKLLEEKKSRAKEVEDAYLAYVKTKEDAYTKIAESEKKWIELRDKFAKDYNGYHMTYTNNNGVKKITFDDIVNSFFNW